MHKQIYQQFLVVIASARAKGQGDRAQGTGPNARLQVPLGIVVYLLHVPLGQGPTRTCMYHEV